MMKKILSVIALLSIIVVATSCKGGSADPKAELLKAVNDLNRACPIQSALFTCESAEMAGQDLVLRCTIEDDVISLIEASPEVVKKVAGSSIFEESADLADLLTRAGFGLKLVFKGSGAGKEVALHFSEQDIKDVKKNPATDEELLDWQLKSTNAMMPLAVDEFTTLVSLERSGRQLTYVYVVDDLNMDFSDFVDGKDQFRQTLMANLEAANTQQSSFGQFLKLVCRSDMALSYQYCAKSSGQVVSIDFTNADLKEIAHYTPQN